jgi:hypothetical protein
MKFKIYITFLISIFYEMSFSQCAMCRAALQNKENTLKAESLNDGIVYLMAIPYVLIAVLSYAIYKLKKKNI